MVPINELTGAAGSWAGWIVPVAIKGSLLLGLFWILNVTLRRASASTRHLLWTLSLVGILLLPIFGSALPSWQVLNMPELHSAPNNPENITPPTAGTSMPMVAEIQLKSNLAPITDRTPKAGASQHPVPEPTPVVGELTLLSLSATTWFYLIWLTGILLIMGLILLAAIQLRRLERHAKILREDGWSVLLESLSKSLKIGRRPLLMRSHLNVTPMTWGIRRVKILLPTGCDRWTVEQRRHVLLHELAHIRRRDCLTHFAAQFACLLYWFNPLVWIAARRMRVERERACDDQVLVTGVKASSYAKNLLDITSTFGSANCTLAVSLGMARRSQISGRLLAVLDPKLRRLAPNRYVTAAVALLTIALVLPLAVLSPIAQADESQSGSTHITLVDDDSDHPIKIRFDGEIKLDRAGRRIEWMSDDAYLRIEQKVEGALRKLVIVPDDDGRPIYTYNVGRKKADFDQEAVDWLGNMLEELAPDGEFLSLELPEVPALPELPELPELPTLPSLPSAESLNIRKNTGSTTIHWETKRDGASRHLELKGKITFNDDDTAILWMDDDAYFKIEEKKGRKKISLEAEAGDDGRPVYIYKVGRSTKPFDDEAARWLAEILQNTLLELGINAEERIRSTYEKDGSQGVLDMIGGVESSYAKSLYYKEFFRLQGINDDDIESALRKMSTDLDSDYEMASILAENEGIYLSSAGTRDAFLECMSAIDSDYEKARVLKAILTEDDLDTEALAVVFTAADEINSDYELARVLKAVLDRKGLTDTEIAGLLKVARNIDSDFEMARVLTEVDPDLLSDASTRQVYFEALTHIDSDYEKSRVLQELAPYAGRNETLREACLEAAETIDSNYEYGRVVKALRKKE